MSVEAKSIKTTTLISGPRCPYCHKVFARHSNLNYHLINGVCTTELIKGKTMYSEFTDIPEEKLRLIIELKEKEIQLAKLALEREQITDNSRDNSQNKTDDIDASATNTIRPNLPSLSRIPRRKVLIKLHKKNTKTKSNLLNFGEENCEVFDRLRPRADIEFIAKELLEALHFNPKYPENNNLYYSDTKDDHLMVYVDNAWQSIYHLTLIDEYLRGNLFRLKQISPLHSKIREIVEEHIEQIHQLCRQTLIESSSNPNS